MITIVKADRKPQETAEVWSHSIEELDYLLTEHNGESFALYDNRLYEITEEQTMNKKIAEIEQDGVRFALWKIEGEGYTIFENDKKTSHHITAPNEEIAEGYFEDYVGRLK